MSEWKAKRFWTDAVVAAADGGFQVLLDGRQVKTPAKAPLIVPSRAMAVAIAAEWQAQDDVINPQTMPVTRGANAAIDKVSVQYAEVVGHVAVYGGSDLLCYRAASPDELIAKQAAAWDPWLAWAEETFDAPLQTTTGVMPVAQSDSALANLTAAVTALGPFPLAGFYDLTQLSGSLVLAFAVARGQIDATEAWALSRIDEDWQIAEWGFDADAAEMAAIKKQAFEDAARFYQMANPAA